MEYESILTRIFYSQDKEEQARSGPVEKKLSDIKNKAYITWYQDNGGEVLLKDMEKQLIHYITTLVGSPIKTLDDFITIVGMKERIACQCEAIDRIEMAFVEEKKRQKKILNK